MISVSMPQSAVSSKKFFAECARASRPISKRKRLKNAAAQVGEAIDQYVEFARGQRLNDMPAFNATTFGASKSDFASLYDSFMVTKESIGRAEYDKIRNAPRGGICPFCATRQVKTVDHFLPKSSYPQFTIAFENLVGCCRDCNTVKLTAASTVAEKTLFHPYFESFPQRDWLVAVIESRHPITLTFSVSDALNTDSVAKKRIENQFQALELRETFAFFASTLFSSQQKTFDGIRDEVGPDGLRSHLQSLAESASEQNHYPWMRAMYIALEADSAFVEGADRVANS
jgi:hypothetical protein